MGRPLFSENATPERIRTFSSFTSLTNITSKGHVCPARDNQARVYESESVAVSLGMSFGHRTLFANSHLSSQSERRRSYAGGVSDFSRTRSTSRLNGLMSMWNRVATPRDWLDLELYYFCMEVQGKAGNFDFEKKV